MRYIYDNTCEITLGMGTGMMNGTILVQPGYPRLCLWPVSVDALYGTANALPRLTPTWDKRYLDLMRNDYQFQLQPLPLTAIYVLGERCTDQSAPFVETVSASTGLMALFANTYATSLLDKGMRAQEFEFLDRIVSSVPLRQVNPHTDPAYLSRLCDAILNDFQALTLSTLRVENTKKGKHV